MFREICRTLSLFLFGLSIPLLLPLGIGIYCEWIVPGKYIGAPVALAFFLTILITLALGGLLHLLGRRSLGHLYRREAFVLVVVVYIAISAVSSLPFLLNRTLPHYVDALFECVSGYTTTGATILEAKRYDNETEIPIVKKVNETTYRYSGTVVPQGTHTGIEALSPALLVWRSLTQFLGGCGIVILFLALLPSLGVGGKVLYQAEATGPSKETMAPRIKETAGWLWKIYFGLTLLELILLLITNQEMSFFDALSISFSTISTGGFAPRNESIAAYNNLCTDVIVMIFMILGSINFSIYFFLMKGKFSKLRDRELRLFLLILLFSTLFTAVMLKGWRQTPLCEEGQGIYSFLQALLLGAFQIISAQTSTGFTIANFDVWPTAVQVLLLVVMYVGGMAGSTAGGIKVVRFQIFLRVVRDKIESFFRPDAVRSLRIGSKTIEEKVAVTALCFLVVVVGFTTLGTFLLVLDGIDIETAFTTTAAMLNNVGFAFRMGGPEHSFAFLSTFGKILSMIWMIAGRLEYFALLVLFVPAFWKLR